MLVFGQFSIFRLTVYDPSKDKALYKACGENLGDGKECNKKLVEQGDGTYRCEKCMRNKEEFKWRIMLQFNMIDCSDNNWATCFQVGQFSPLKV